MARTAGKFIAPLLCALFAKLSSANEFSTVLKGLTGKNSVSCHDVCQAASHLFRRYSSSWSSSSHTTTCTCTKETYEVNCELSSSYQFTSCCIQGKGCGESDDPDPIEEAMALGTEELPASFDIPQEDVSVDTVLDCPACPGAKYELLKHEMASVHALHNKMRAAVGTPPLTWNCHLMCQVQKHADKCQFAHSTEADKPIPAGENMATGTDGEFAAWMWFSEYGRYPPTEHAQHEALHFTAMVWKATTKLGCGVCKDSSVMGGGLFFCQYSDHQPNWNNAFVENVPKFEGTTAQYTNAGLDAEKAKEVFNLISGWGIGVGDALTRFYTTAPDGETPIEGIDRPLGFWAQAPVAALAMAGAVVLSGAFVFAVRRPAPDFRSLQMDYATRDEEELACSLAEQ